MKKFNGVLWVVLSGCFMSGFLFSHEGGAVQHLTTLRAHVHDDGPNRTPQKTTRLYDGYTTTESNHVAGVHTKFMDTVVDQTPRTATPTSPGGHKAPVAERGALLDYASTPGLHNPNAAALHAMVTTDDTLNIMARLLESLKRGLTGAKGEHHLPHEIAAGLERLENLREHKISLYVSGTLLTEDTPPHIFYDARTRAIHLSPFKGPNGQIVDPGLYSNITTHLAGHCGFDEMIGGLYAHEMHGRLVHSATASWMSILYAIHNPRLLDATVLECGPNLHNATSLWSRTYPLEVRLGLAPQDDASLTGQVKLPGFEVLGKKKNPYPETTSDAQNASRVLSGVLFDVAAKIYAHNLETGSPHVPYREHLQHAMTSVTKLYFLAVFDARTSQHDMHISNIAWHMEHRAKRTAFQGQYFNPLWATFISDSFKARDIPLLADIHGLQHSKFTTKNEGALNQTLRHITKTGRHAVSSLIRSPSSSPRTPRKGSATTPKLHRKSLETEAAKAADFDELSERVKPLMRSISTDFGPWSMGNLGEILRAEEGLDQTAKLLALQEQLEAEIAEKEAALGKAGAAEALQAELDALRAAAIPVIKIAGPDSGELEKLRAEIARLGKRLADQKEAKSTQRQEDARRAEDAIQKTFATAELQRELEHAKVMIAALRSQINEHEHTNTTLHTSAKELKAAMTLETRKYGALIEALRDSKFNAEAESSVAQTKKSELAQALGVAQAELEAEKRRRTSSRFSEAEEKQLFSTLDKTTTENRALKALLTKQSGIAGKLEESMIKRAEVTQQWRDRALAAEERGTHGEREIQRSRVLQHPSDSGVWDELRQHASEMHRDMTPWNPHGHNSATAGRTVYTPGVTTKHSVTICDGTSCDRDRVYGPFILPHTKEAPWARRV